MSSFIIHWEYDLSLLTLPILANLYHQGDVQQQFSQQHRSQMTTRKQLPDISTIRLSYIGATTGQWVPVTETFPTNAEAGWRKLCFARFWVVPIEANGNSLLSCSRLSEI